MAAEKRDGLESPSAPHDQALPQVCHVVENLDDLYGGPARSVPNLMSHLRGFDIQGKALSVAWATDESNDVIRNSSLEWEHFALSGPRKIGYSPDLSRALVKCCSEPARIVHLHNLWNYVAYVSWRRARRHSAPLVISPRGSLYPWSLQQGRRRKALAWYVFQERALNEAAFIHATDRSEAEEVRRLGIKSPIAIVPNGVEQIPVRAQKRLKESRRARGENDGKSYLFMSRIHRKKGVDILLQAWAQSSARTRGCKLRIVGPCADNRYATELQNIISHHDMQDSVSMSGMVKGTARETAFADADFFVLPSHTENFGIVVAEALTRGLPVMTTKGTPWAALDTTGSGWWVELSVEEFARLFDNTSRLPRHEICSMGDNAFNLAGRYAWRKQARKMTKAYKWVLGGPKPPFVFMREDSI